MSCFALAFAIALAQSPDAASVQESTKNPVARSSPEVVVADRVWHDNYGDATRMAVSQKQMLLILFETQGASRAADRFQTKLDSDAKLQEKLANYTLAKLSTDTEIVVDGKPLDLLSHPAFAEMGRQPGLCILDYTNEDSPYYGRVVSAFPFASSVPISTGHLPIILDLPQGSITQRTMVFAVRIHPEGPASTMGDFDPLLAREASSHSRHQARIHVQGHHNWERRFHRISGLLGRGLRAQEVVAESWPNENLLEACVDCVDSWRQSSGHWSAVRSFQPAYAYDIKRGGNGIWYATGIFGNRH